MEIRIEYDKWTVMRIKTKLRECEQYISVLELYLLREERGTKGKNTVAERRESTDRETT